MRRNLALPIACAGLVVSSACITHGASEAEAPAGDAVPASEVLARYDARSPEAAVLAFFAPDGIADKEQCYTGEMLEHFKDEPTLGESLPPGIGVAIRPLAATRTLRPFAITLSQDDLSQDWYAYAREESDGWKLEAVRCLALTEIPYEMLQQLDAKADRTADEEWDYRNLLLSLMSDADLKAFATANVRALDEVADLFEHGNAEQATAAARALHLRRVRRSKDGNVELTIGSMVDNAVGFLFVPDGSTAPAIDPSGYIYVEPIVGRWWVFKTT